MENEKLNLRSPWIARAFLEEVRKSLEKSETSKSNWHFDKRLFGAIARFVTGKRKTRPRRFYKAVVHTFYCTECGEIYEQCLLQEGFVTTPDES